MQSSKFKEHVHVCEQMLKNYIQQQKTVFVLGACVLSCSVYLPWVSVEISEKWYTSNRRTEQASVRSGTITTYKTKSHTCFCRCSYRTLCTFHLLQTPKTKPETTKKQNVSLLSHSDFIMVHHLDQITGLRHQNF